MNSLEHHKELIAVNHLDYNSLLPLIYTFEHKGLPFECQVLKNDDNVSYIVNLTTILGHLPYSAENINKRQMMLKQLGPLISQSKVIIDRHCKLTFPIKTVINGELSALIIMETILYSLLDVRGTLDVIKNALYIPDFVENKKQTA